MKDVHIVRLLKLCKQSNHTSKKNNCRHETEDETIRKKLLPAYTQQQVKSIVECINSKILTIEVLSMINEKEFVRLINCMRVTYIQLTY